MVLLVLLLVVLLRLPAVQTFVGNKVTKSLNSTYGTNIRVKKVDLSFLGDVKLKEIEILDHRKDSLIYVKSLNTSIFSYQNILNNKLELGEVDLEGVRVNMTMHKGDTLDNMSVFFESFDDGGPPSEHPFLMTSSLLNLKDVHFTLYDKNKQEAPIVYYKEIEGKIEDFKIEGPNVSLKTDGISFVDDHGIYVTNFTTDFTYTKTQMNFANTKLLTEDSEINGDIVFNYKREDLAEFNDKVKVNANFKKSVLSLKDLNKFYNEFGEYTKVEFATSLEGVLNNFTLKELKLVSNRNSVIDADLHIKNVFNKDRGFSVDARIYELTSNYQNLKRLLPNLLGKTLPSTLDKFGSFTLAGQSFINRDMVDANITIKSALGRTITDLTLTNIDHIDNANYQGSIEFIDLEFGKIVNDSLIGKLSVVADVNGKGFTLDKIDTNIEGAISKYQYKGYTYSNIDINGNFKNQLFNGKLVANDENLKMVFTGLADFSSSRYKFDFQSDVTYSDFNKLNLFKRDEKAVLKGEMVINITGNSIDDIVGDINFKNASYTNQNDNYYFTDFNITSRFQDSLRILTVNSSDIIEGSLKGKFRFAELKTLARNSLGSIYTNFKPYKVTSGQFLDFNFKIYNKVVGIFFPEINLGPNTTVRGEMNSDQSKFELLVKSPQVEAYGNIIDAIRLQIDNRNPIYNTLLSVDKIDTKHYDVANLNLVNITLNDTLFFRTEFYGGRNENEKFDLSFYHTINENNKSVVGLKRSNIKFRENEWLINPLDNKQNKLVIDHNFKTYAIDKINMVAGDQKIDIAGVIIDNKNKDLNLEIENVLLQGITPDLEDIDLKGLVNGSVNLKQVQGDYLPIANVTIDDLYVNEFKQGDLVLSATGDNSLNKYIIDATLENEKLESLNLKGEIDIEPEQPTIFANFNLKDYDIRPYNTLGKGVLDRIRGTVSGVGTVTGVLKNPDINGTLYLKNGGLAFPYLNVDYDFIGLSEIQLKDQSINFVNTTLVDVVHDTEATLKGTISHTGFDNWFLDLLVETDNLLVLNTKESDEIPYYGTGFLGKSNETGERARATIKGFTDRLNIDIAGTTKPGTEFIIPLSDVSTIGDTKLITFVNSMESGDNYNVVEDVVFNQVKGLFLNFDLEVNDDARAEIVVDKNTGSVLSGRGAGYLNIVINTNGRFDIFGTYVVSEGIYEFRNIVNKDFTVQPGGSVIWTGNPFDAYLNNITAVYRTRGNPSILLDYGASRDVDVDLIAKISGQLLNSDIEFDLQIPNSSSLANSELQFKLSDQDKKMAQFFSLLTFGDFTNIDEGNFNFNANAFGGTFISQKISNVLNTLLKSRGEKFDIGLSYDLGTRDNLNSNLNTDDRLGFTASTRLGKNIIVNGKVGVPIGGNTQSRVVGEVEVEVPLNEPETFRLKAYNRQNEIQFTVANEEGYTQGVGLSYQVDFNTAKELVNKIFGEKKKEKEKVNNKIDTLKTDNKLIEFSTIKRDTIRSKGKTPKLN